MVCTLAGDDFVAPWPALQALRERTEAAGQRLALRLPVYPEYLFQPSFLAPAVREACLARVESSGYLPEKPAEAA